jgi:membrane-associated phospholipid phosphatase
MTASKARVHAPLGAGPRMLARILAHQLFLPALAGYHGAAQIHAMEVSNWITGAITLAGFAFLAAALWRGPRLLQQGALFAGLQLAACLASPSASSTQPQWLVMTYPPMCNRYFTMPILLCIGAMITLIAKRNWQSLLGSAALAMTIFMAIPADWQQPRWHPTDFYARARAFATAPKGTEMKIPIVPDGLNPGRIVKK